MIGFLRRKRVRDEIASVRRQLTKGERDRAPLETARLCRRLAELYAGEEKRPEAVRWFGHCIDAYVYAGYAGAATTMCARLIEFEPRVIRARATLAMLHLVHGRHLEALDEIEGYVEVTRERGEQIELTRRRLRVMADLSEDPAVRNRIAQSLLDLGAIELGTEILVELRHERTGGTRPPLTEQEKWRRLIEGAGEASGDRDYVPADGRDRSSAVREGDRHGALPPLLAPTSHRPADGTPPLD